MKRSELPTHKIYGVVKLFASSPAATLMGADIVYTSYSRESAVSKGEELARTSPGHAYGVVCLDAVFAEVPSVVEEVPLS